MEHSIFLNQPPDSTYEDDEENLQLRTISVGDYDSLFVAEEDPAALEAARQEKTDDFFNNGNPFYWTTLSIIIIGAVVQECSTNAGSRRYPTSRHESRCAAGFRRGILSVITILIFAWSLDSSQLDSSF